MILQRWLIYALLSALAAAFVGIFGKVGMKEVDSTLATTVRSVAMTIFLVSVSGAVVRWRDVQRWEWTAIVMIVLSGLAGALSWLFYFRAIQLGKVSQVAPIDKLSMPLAVVLAVVLLGEKPGVVNWIGIVLMAGGAYLAAR